MGSLGYIIRSRRYIGGMRRYIRVMRERAHAGSFLINGFPSFCATLRLLICLSTLYFNACRGAVYIFSLLHHIKNSPCSLSVSAVKSVNIWRTSGQEASVVAVVYSRTARFSSPRIGLSISSSGRYEDPLGLP